MVRMKESECRHDDLTMDEGRREKDGVSVNG